MNRPRDMQRRRDWFQSVGTLAAGLVLMSLPALAGLAWATSVALTEKSLPLGTPGAWSPTGNSNMDRRGHTAPRSDRSQRLGLDGCGDSSCITGSAGAEQPDPLRAPATAAPAGQLYLPVVFRNVTTRQT